MGRNRQVLGRRKLRIQYPVAFIIYENIQEALFMVLKMYFRTRKMKDWNNREVGLGKKYGAKAKRKTNLDNPEPPPPLGLRASAGEQNRPA